MRARSTGAETTGKSRKTARWSVGTSIAGASTGPVSLAFVAGRPQMMTAMLRNTHGTQARPTEPAGRGPRCEVGGAAAPDPAPAARARDPGSDPEGCQTRQNRA